MASNVQILKTKLRLPVRACTKITTNEVYHCSNFSKWKLAYNNLDNVSTSKTFFETYKSAFWYV